jgi:hypothetical protein
MKTIAKTLSAFGSMLVFSTAVLASPPQNLRTLTTSSCPSTFTEKPKAEAIPALLVLVIPELISFGVDMAATAFDEAAKAKITTLSTESAPFNYYTIDNMGELSLSNEFRCVVLVAGGDAASSEAAAPPAWLRAAKHEQKLNWMRSTPDFYSEFEIRQRDDDTGFVLVPRLMYIGSSFEPARLWRRGERDYVAAFSFKNAADLSAFGAASFAFTGLSAGNAYSKNGDLDTQRLATWPDAIAVAKLPEAGDVSTAVVAQKATAAPYREANAVLRSTQTTPPLVKDGIASRKTYIDGLTKLCTEIAATNRINPKQPISDQRCPVSLFNAHLALAKIEDVETLIISRSWAAAFFERECKAKGKIKSTNVESKQVEVCALPEPTPANIGLAQISAMVTETADATKFIKSLAATFDKKKEDVKTGLNDRLNPARRDELEASKLNDQQTARQQYVLAKLSVQQYEAQLVEAASKSESAKVAIQIQLTQAKIDANKAATKAGQTVPYPEYN